MKTRVSQPHVRWSGLLAGLLLLAPALALAQQVPPQQAPRQAPAGGGIEREKTFPQIESAKWTGHRLADGQPDVSGHWSNTISNHSNFTDPQAGVINDPSFQKRTAGPRNERAPSRVSDPADGQVPFLPWAAARVKDFQANFNNPTKPEYVEPLARCAPSGVPKSFYWHGYEIRQYTGYVLILFDSGYRLIHLDNKPHLPESIKLWNADSRGHWEGNTLVVDVTNNNSKALFGRSGEFASENVHVRERYIFAGDGQRYNYVAEITDPTVYTRPWTVTIPARRWSENDTPNGWHYIAAVANTDGKGLLHERYERICTENNGGFGDPTGGAKK